MIRWLPALLGVGLGLAVSAAAAQTPIDVVAPAPALRSTATLVLADGAGTQRLALWRATNARGELCLGWKVARTASPSHFACLRGGLERLVLEADTLGVVAKLRSMSGQPRRTGSAVLEDTLH